MPFSKNQLYVQFQSVDLCTEYLVLFFGVKAVWSKLHVNSKLLLELKQQNVIKCKQKHLQNVLTIENKIENILAKKFIFNLCLNQVKSFYGIKKLLSEKKYGKLKPSVNLEHLTKCYKNNRFLARGTYSLYKKKLLIFKEFLKKCQTLKEGGGGY